MFRADFSEIIIDLDEETKIRKVVRELITSWIIISILRTSSLRVALIEYDIIDEPVIEEDMLRENKIDEAWEIFLSLTGYTAITLNTMGEFVCNTTHYLKIQPHIIVSAPKSPLFAEENWEWIRIGNIVMKKIMIVSNLTSVQESYKKNVCHHPPSFLGNFYRLFTVGTANLNDNVYVHVERTPNCPNFNLLI
ncbi:PREDICTED: uncharacterized protein LOC108773716 [Cyphomyrmex costatus]|uniref:uncharacterized protein LOC108773716 n=1 Tax=Cyphomyrmex costatus TaxID=456900 RepID=UPI00085245DE|nr:PREDICTED: uncharacterized protein LOC108773716 [Cyphomyrmex costatus]